MVYLSKSKYCGLWQCPKIAWLKKYKPEEIKVDPQVIARMDAGNEVGDLAMGLFGDYTEVTAFDGDKIDIKQMIENTKAEIEKGTPVICEASFEYNGLYCAVDILKKENGGFAIYEVKSSTKYDKAVYAADVAYQKYVLENCGVNVTGTYLGLACPAGSGGRRIAQRTPFRYALERWHLSGKRVRYPRTYDGPLVGFQSEP